MKTFALFVAPWDLAERGTRDLLVWARDQGINTIILATVYHAGWLLHPHYRRKAYMVEDGCCYFHPDLSEYDATPLKPTVARLVADHDWVAETRAETDKLNLRLLLWTVCLHNSRLGLAYSQFTCNNVYGDSYPHALCPSHPAVREYVRALVADQAKQYHPDGFLLEATGYHRGRTHGSPAGGIAGHHHERDGLPMPGLEQHLLNVSFADTDRRAAESAGIDVRLLHEVIRGHLDAFFQSAPRRPAELPDTFTSFCDAVPDLARYEDVLSTQANELVQQVKSQPRFGDIELLGDTIRSAFDGLLLGCYNKPANAIGPSVADARERLAREVRRKRLVVGVRLGFNPPPQSPAINSQVQGCCIASEIAKGGADGLAFYFYGEAPATSLRWIKPMIHAAGAREIPTGTKPEQTVNVGLIGAGAIGEIHLRSLARVPGVRLWSAADSNPAKARHLADRLQIKHVANDAHSLIADEQVDLVVIASPPDSHVVMSRLALEAGKHVLLEKPTGRSLAECDGICRAAAGTSRAIGVALVHRYDGARFAVRDLIRHGAIGRVLKASYRWGKAMYDDPRFNRSGTTDRDWLVDSSVAGGGILPSSTIHVFSTLVFLLGDETVISVAGDVRCLHPRGFRGIEDDVDLILNFSNGAAATVHESWVTDCDYEMCIDGELGRLILAGPTFNEVSLTGFCRGPIPHALRRFFEGRELCCRPHELDDSVPPYFDGLAADMIAACRGEQPLALPDLLHALNMRAIISAAMEASRTGCRQAVEWTKTLSRPEAARAAAQELAQ